MPDFSRGINQLMFALAGGPRRELEARAIVDRYELQEAQTELNRQKIMDAVSERERKAKLSDPHTFRDVLAAEGDITPQNASDLIRRWNTGPGDALSPTPPQGLDPDVVRVLGRKYGALRRGVLFGGKAHEVATAQKILGEDALREEAAAAVRAGGDPDVVNRLTSVLAGRAYQPYSSGQHGVYNQATGERQDPRLYEADVGATRNLGAERAEHAAQRRLETENLRTSGAKEPGRGTGGATGGKQQQFAQWRLEMLMRSGVPEKEATRIVAGGAGHVFTPRDELRAGMHLFANAKDRFGRPLFKSLEEARVAVRRAAQAQAQGDVERRFGADSSVPPGARLGELRPNGRYEVLDASGQLIGEYEDEYEDD